jgi:hypothetical protein
MTHQIPGDGRRTETGNKRGREDFSQTWRNCKNFVRQVHITKVKAVDPEAKLQEARESPSPRIRLERPCAFRGHQDLGFVVTFHLALIARAR